MQQEYGSIKPKLLFVIVCDAVAQSPDGKKTLYGLFDRIATLRIPCVHPSFSIMVRWGYGDGKHSMKIRIVDSNREVAFEPADECKFEITDLLSTTDIVLNIQNMTFKKTGMYWVEVYLNGVKEEQEVGIFVERVRIQKVK